MTVNTFYSRDYIFPYAKPDEHGQAKNETKIFTSLMQCLLNSTEIALLGKKGKQHTTQGRQSFKSETRVFKAKKYKNVII